MFQAVALKALTLFVLEQSRLMHTLKHSGAPVWHDPLSFSQENEPIDINY